MKLMTKPALIAWVAVGVVTFAGGLALDALAANPWVKKGEMPSARIGQAAVSLNGLIYVIGGDKDGSVSVYDPALNKWSARHNMPVPKAEFGAAVINGRIYCIGGAEADVEEYDPATDVWTMKASFIRYRTNLAVVGLGNKAYAIGGWITGDCPFVDEYDPMSDTWVRKADLLTARHALAAVPLNGKILVVAGAAPINGGRNSTDSPKVEEYDPSANASTRKASLASPRAYHASATLNGSVYAIGGMEDRADMEEYDAVKNRWRARTAIPQGMWMLCAVEAAGRLYVMGGRTGETRAVRSIWEYDPSKDSR